VENSGEIGLLNVGVFGGHVRPRTEELEGLFSRERAVNRGFADSEVSEPSEISCVYERLRGVWL
jgi:hypothetical protein